ncbi:MAG: amino acid kinase family protein [Gaiellaceae bacterium]
MSDLVVIKLGGAVSNGAAGRVLALAREHRVCVVHGAGPQISAEMARRGHEVQFVSGRRVTTAEGIEAVRHALAQVNADLCSAIGERAIGLMGDEIGLEATQVPELGLVGEPVSCAPAAIVEALGRGEIPVVAPLAAGPLNVNADEAAAMLAIGLGAARIEFVTDVPGLLIDGQPVESIHVAEADALLGSGDLEGGIIPKLSAAVRAARGGVVAEIGRTAVVA